VLSVEKVLSELIQIKSVNPPGGETGVASYLKRLFDEYGIPGEIIEPEPGRGSFVASLGKGERSLLYLSHIDTVPVSDGWNLEPFGGEIRDGLVHGRGALDCKGLAAAQACAVLNIAQNTRLKGRLIFAATAGEETGGVLGAKYLADNHRDKIMADYTLTEGGWEPMTIGGKVCHFIQVGEKGIIRFRLRTKGVSAHGSLPMLGDNAVAKMSGVIQSLAGYQPRVSLIPEVKQVVQAIAALEGFSDEITEENITTFISGQQDKVLAAYLSAITRISVSPNVVHGGMKANIIPDSCEAEVDVRVLPGQQKEGVMAELGQFLDDAETEIYQYNPPTFSGADSVFYKVAAETMQEFVGNATVLPCMSSGSTDSRHLRGLGMPCYGIGMMALNLDPSMARTVHGRDERIDVGSLRLKSDFLVALARKYLGE
jgi:acetylornithine deacetylase/succinyl-diaminopimelate desuccinylase-like protein